MTETNQASQIGCVESLWRYPVKSMAGEELPSAWLDERGMAGDRRMAVISSSAPRNFPYLTARAQEQMLLYRPRWMGGELVVDLPDGECLTLEDPLLLKRLGTGLAQAPVLSLRRAEEAQTDARPVSLFSLQTAQQLERELGTATDKLRFRANIYADFPGRAGFCEDELVGRELKIGATVVLAIVERDPRCKMITLDPGTAEAMPALIRHVAAAHGRCAGVYAEVLVEGEVCVGDAIVLRS